jgi:hypothetical protein
VHGFLTAEGKDLMDDAGSSSRLLQSFFRVFMVRCLQRLSWTMSDRSAGVCMHFPGFHGKVLAFFSHSDGARTYGPKGLMTHRLLVVMQELDAFAGDQVDCLSGWGDNHSFKSFNIMTSALESSFVSCCWSKPFFCVLISPKLQTISVQDILACTQFVQILVDTFVMISPLVFYPSMGVYCIPCVGIIACYTG